jgi:hypothetical protein
VDTSDWELKSSTAGTGLCLALGLASFASSGHFDLIFGLTGQTEFQNLNDTCLLKLTNLYPSEDPLQLKSDIGGSKLWLKPSPILLPILAPKLH